MAEQITEETKRKASETLFLIQEKELILTEIQTLRLLIELKLQSVQRITRRIGENLPL